VKEHPLPAFGLLPSQEALSHFPGTIPSKAFKDHFPPGTKMYNTTISTLNDIEVLASASTILLLNKTANSLPVDVDGMMISLHPYEVRVIDSRLSLLGTLQMLIGFITSIALIVYQYLKSRRIQGDHK
jgi:hypothetical protein